MALIQAVAKGWLVEAFLLLCGLLLRWSLHQFSEIMLEPGLRSCAFWGLALLNKMDPFKFLATEQIKANDTAFLRIYKLWKKMLPILFFTWKGMNERLFGDKYWACLLGTHDGFIVQLLLLSKREKRLSGFWKFACPFHQKEDRWKWEA